MRIVTAIVLLGSALAVQLAGESLSSRRAVQHAGDTRLIARRSTALLDAATALAAERGLVNGLLAAPSATPQPIREAIAGQRAKADAALRAALDGLPDLPDLDRDKLSPARAAMQETAARVATLRMAAGKASGAPTQATWFAAATAQIDAVTGLRRLLDASSNEENDTTRLIAVRDALGDMAEYTGRERGRINGVIAGNGRLQTLHLAFVFATGNEQRSTEAAIARLAGAEPAAQAA